MLFAYLSYKFLKFYFYTLFIQEKLNDLPIKTYLAVNAQSLNCSFSSTFKAYFSEIQISLLRNIWEYYSYNKIFALYE